MELSQKLCFKQARKLQQQISGILGWMQKMMTSTSQHLNPIQDREN